MTEPDPLVREFLVESYENLDRLDQDFVALEQNPRDDPRLRSVFRTIHTIKGTCGFFGFSKLEAVTHVGENLLCRLRDGELVLDPEITSALLALVDAVRRILAEIETTGGEGAGEYAALIDTLTKLAESEPGEKPVSPPPPTPVPAPMPEPVAKAAEPPKPVPVEPSSPALEAGPVSSVSEGNVRVDVILLDKLMNLVGELVLARNQILQYAVAHPDPALAQTTQRLNLIATELQEGVMKTRMQQIGTIWNRFPRVVRDLAAQCGKQIRLDMDGQATELDRTILEAIKDPLTHVVRNSVDHGIESPAARVAAGKPAEGRLLLRAFHEGARSTSKSSTTAAASTARRSRTRRFPAASSTATTPHECPTGN